MEGHHLASEVNELVRHSDATGREYRLDRADTRGGDDSIHLLVNEGPDVGLVIDFVRWGDATSFCVTMPAEEGCKEYLARNGDVGRTKSVRSLTAA